MKQIFLIVSIVFSLFSCKIEEAKPLAAKKIVIASDFLYPKDAKCFAEFEKDHKIRVEIIHMRADSMHYRMKKDGYNTGFDMLFVKSLQSVKELKQQPVQVITEGFQKAKLGGLQRIQENWFLVGRDPFVITFLKDSVKKPETYRELTTSYLWASPDLQGVEVLKAQVTFQFQHQKDTKEANKNLKDWLRGLKDHRINYQEPGNNAKNTQLLLLSYRSYIDLQPQIYAKNRRVIFPEKTYYDYFATAIVPQAKNYTSAKSFMAYLSAHGQHYEFLKRLHMSPLGKNKKGTSFYISPTAVLSLLNERM